MKVLELGCEHDHRFEGWFGSTEDYDSQHARGLVECPICGSRDVRRLPNATRLNLSGGRQAAAAPTTDAQASRPAAGQTMTVAAGSTAQQLQEMWAGMVRHVMNSTENVGERFAEEARRIHYKEAPERGIRGVATPEQARELVEEGIEVVALPMPRYSSETVQ